VARKVFQEARDSVVPAKTRPRAGRRDACSEWQCVFLLPCVREFIFKHLLLSYRRQLKHTS